MYATRYLTHSRIPMAWQYIQLQKWVEVSLLPTCHFGPRWGWVVSVTHPRPSEGPGAYCTGGWVGPGTCLDGTALEVAPYRNSIDEPSGT